MSSRIKRAKGARGQLVREQLRRYRRGAQRIREEERDRKREAALQAMAVKAQEAARAITDIGLSAEDVFAAVRKIKESGGPGVIE